MTPERLREIEERVEKATSGPWAIRVNYNERHLEAPSIAGSLMCNMQYYPWTPDREEDWHFIAHARQDIPDLLTEVQRLRQERDEARAARDQAEAANMQDHLEAVRLNLGAATDGYALYWRDRAEAAEAQLRTRGTD